MESFCDCLSSNCLSSKGRSMCICRANRRLCSSLCKCGNGKLGCSNGKTLSASLGDDTENFDLESHFFSKIKENKNSSKKRKTQNAFGNHEILQPNNTAKPNYKRPQIKPKRVNTAPIRNQQNEVLLSQLGPDELRGVLWAILQSKRLFLKDFLAEGNEDGLLKPITKFSGTSATSSSDIIQKSSNITCQQITEKELKINLNNSILGAAETFELSFHESTDDDEVRDDPNEIVRPPSPPPENNQPNWCKCTKCIDMPTPDERRCCSSKRNTGCITENPLFPLLCINRAVLATQLQLRYNIAAYDWENNNDCFRYAAYRQFICWRYGRLGKSNRRVIPACVVHAIRTVYPKANQLPYTGFKAVRPLM